MRITHRQLIKLIREYRASGTGPTAHPRGDLGKNIADADFPIVVGYELNGREQSEIAYNQDELDDILDDITGGPGGNAIDIPYSLDSLKDMEPDQIPAGAEIEQLAAGKIRITKKQLSRLISEVVTGGGTTAEGGVELTNPEVSESEISSAWPSNVTWNGHNVYEMFYGGGTVDEVWGFLEREGYGDGQEAYLGYDPDSDTFVMGFDAFYDDVDEYGNASHDSEMEGVLVNLGVSGAGGSARFEDILEQVPGGMYPTGLRTVEKLIPGIIHVRLD